MTSITIHNIGSKLDNFIRKKASNSGNSLNKTIKKLLQAYIYPLETRKKNKLDRFFGIWTKNEAKKFDKVINEEFEKVDKSHNA